MDTVVSPSSLLALKIAELQIAELKAGLRRSLIQAPRMSQVDVPVYDSDSGPPDEDVKPCDRSPNPENQPPVPDSAIQLERTLSRMTLEGQASQLQVEEMILRDRAAAEQAIRSPQQEGSTHANREGTPVNAAAGQGSAVIRPKVQQMVTHKSRTVTRRLRYSWILTTGNALLLRPCVGAEQFVVGSVYVHQLADRSPDSAQQYQLWVCAPVVGAESGSESFWQLAPSDPSAIFPHPDPRVPLFLRYLPEVGRPSWVLMRSKDRYRQKKETLEIDPKELLVVGGSRACYR